jgi:NitT/TauT family transport system substrate-binding protein
MAAAPTLDRAQQEFMLAEIKHMMTSGNAAKNGLYWIDPQAIRTAHDFFLKYGVISKPVDIAAAFNASFLDSIPLADRLP